MFSNILDKLLIILMITILPVSIFFASQNQKKIESETAKKLEEEQMLKITSAVQQIQNQNQIEQTPNIDIEQVYYASESGKLVVKGKAPKKNMKIMVSAVLTPLEQETSKSASSSAKTINSTNVLGQEVEVIAVETDEEGNFTFVKKITPNEVKIIDLRLDQDKSSATVQYDFIKKKQTI